MKDTIQLKTDRITQTAKSWLQNNSSFSSKPVRCRIDGHTYGTYLINLVKINKAELMLQEIVTSQDAGQEIFRKWSLIKKDNWEVGEAQKFSRPLSQVDLAKELSELEQRIDLIKTAEEGRGVLYEENLIKAEDLLAINHPPNQKKGQKNPIYIIKNYVTNHPLTTLVLIFLLLSFCMSSIYYVQITVLERKVELAISNYSAHLDNKVETFIKDTENEIHTLVKELQKKRSSFENDRKNAFINIMRLSEELGNHLPARKAAYNLIAENILSAASYGEIFFEISRLPSEEYQARRLIATDRQVVIPLSEHTPIFSGMLHPVRLKNERNDGRGFRITDGYMRERQDPFGAGGILPHFAVDIINVSNIAYVNYSGQIIRDGNHPGYVVSTFPGLVEDKGYDERYGWYVIIRHETNEELIAVYPEAQSWATFYSHLKEAPMVKKGTEIDSNHIIGEIGNTGYSTGPHLHYEVRIFHPRGIFIHNEERFDKINPYPTDDN